MKRSQKILILVAILIISLFSLTYFTLLRNGKYVFDIRTKQVNTMMEYYPFFFEEIFSKIFSYTLSCSGEPQCISDTRNQLDTLSSSIIEKNVPVDTKNDRFLGNSSNFKPSNQQPMYFIYLLPDGKIAKLFFSGALIFEPVDTKGEILIKEVLEGKRNGLYGLQLREEISLFGREQIFKTRYLKDLYSQAEVIVPYKVNDEIIGAVVYLHGE